MLETNGDYVAFLSAIWGIRTSKAFLIRKSLDYDKNYTRGV